MSFTNRNNSSATMASFGLSNKSSLYSTLISNYKKTFIFSLLYCIGFFSSLLILIFGAFYFGYWLYYMNLGYTIPKFSFDGYVQGMHGNSTYYALNGVGFLALLICGIILFLGNFVFMYLSVREALKTFPYFGFIKNNTEQTDIKYRTAVRFLDLEKRSTVAWYLLSPIYGVGIAYRIEYALEIAFSKSNKKKNKQLENHSNK